MSALTPELRFLCGQLQALAYRDLTASYIRIHGTRLKPVAINRLDSQGYVFEGGPVPIIVFRGTEASKSLKDIRRNFFGGKTRWAGKGRVQNDYLKAFNLMRVPVEKAVAPYDKLAVTGHSMGGALAQIFAALYPGKVHALITFASTKALDREALTALDHVPTEHHCIKGDWAPKWPWRFPEPPNRIWHDAARWSQPWWDKHSQHLHARLFGAV